MTEPASLKERSDRAVVAPWRVLESWTAPSAFVTPQALPRRWRSSVLASVVEHITDRVEVQPDANYKMAGIRWYGEGLFLRETVLGSSLSARHVAPLVPGALVYNRLFAWKGAFALVTDSFSDCYVSNEFPQFMTESDRLLPAYLQLFCTRERTGQLIANMSTGSTAVSRNRLKVEDFLAIQIPLPPLAHQEQVVEKWHLARTEIAHSQTAASAAREAINDRFLSELGLGMPSTAQAPVAFSSPWATAERWSVRFNQLNRSSADVDAGTFPVVSLDELLTDIQYGTSAKANTRREGVPILRIGNVKNGALDLRDLKHVVLPERELANVLLGNGDLLVIRTSGSRDLVGTCAVFREPDPFVFASYLIRLKVPERHVVPEFIAFFLNSPHGRVQIDALSRKIMQNNLNAQEIRSLRIPVPPLRTQKRIMRWVARELELANQRRLAAAELGRRLDLELEEFVLGQRGVREVGLT